MQTINKGGDVLARGNSKCTYPPANDGGQITQKRWDAMWEGFDTEAYKNKPVEGGTGVKETTTTKVLT